MLIHMFVFRWKASSSHSDKQRAVSEIGAFSGAIPGLIEVHVGMNVTPGEFQTGGVMKFSDEKALAAYQSHPLHRELLDWLLPLIDPIEVDFVSVG